MHVEIVTEGFRTPNGRAFLFPLIVHRRPLADAGVTFALRHRGDAARDCDVVVVDSKYLRNRWANEADGIFAELEHLKRRTPCLVYADIGDSAGWLQPRVLPFIDVYWKSMLLRDRRRYLRPIYGHRVYSEHYHERYGIDDAKPESSLPVEDVRDLAKLRIGWNSGLADYTALGPYRMAAFERVPLRFLLRFPQSGAQPSVNRSINLHCRMGMNYSRASVAHQRAMIAKKLAGRVAASKVGRRHYIREIERSKLVLSPFGFGEITLKDFEVFLSGALLLKPDMSHLETWPDLYRPGETIVVHDWDLADLDAVIDRVLTNYPDHLHIARQGQGHYIDHLAQSRLFVQHFLTLISKPLAKENTVTR